MKAIINGVLVLADAVLAGHSLIFDDKIRAISNQASLSTGQSSKVIDAEGCFVAPGFIDIHVHGFGGADTLDAGGLGIAKMRRQLPATGVTAFLPTTISHTLSRLQEAQGYIRAAMAVSSGAAVLGCHLEGPFISEQARGAHAARHLVLPTPGVLEEFSDVLKIVTLAPELPGAAELIAQCLKVGIKVAIGHTAATYEQAMDAVSGGASLFAHVFNAMPPLHHRAPGALGAALDSDAYCELIADNIHVHPAMQRLLARAKRADRIILITDSTMAGLPDGTYELHGQEVTVQEQAVRLPSGQLAGSALPLNRAVRNFIANTGLSLPKAVRLVTANPARLLGLSRRKGGLAVGMDADITVFDDNLEIRRTLVGGEYAYSK